MRQKKYIKGQPLTVFWLAKAVNENKYVMMRDKPQHAGWIRSMQFGTLLAYLKRGSLFEAILNPDYRELKRRK